MSPSALGLLASVLCTAAAATGEDTVAGLSIPLPLELVEQAMPPPPKTVVLKTNYYGTVTVNHQAHLARKIHCKDCHGQGPVRRIEFTPKLAHERCRGCHAEQKRGPTDCRGCHVMPPQGPATLTTEAQPPAGPPAKGDAVFAKPAAGAVSAPLARTSPDAVVAPLARVSPDAVVAPLARAGAGPVTGGAATVPPLPPAGEPISPLADGALEGQDLRRAVHLGGTAGTGYGASARISSRQGQVVLSHALDRLGGSGPPRTLALMGAGALLPLALPSSLGVVAEGVVGVDARERPTVDVMPALGARLGLEWTPRWSHQFPLLLSVTGVVDLFHRGLASPACVYATVGVGAPLTRR
jgi:hypothetical protein